MAPRYRGHELCGPGGGLFCVCPAHFHCPPKYPPNKRAVCAAWRIFSLCSLTSRHAFCQATLLPPFLTARPLSVVCRLSNSSDKYVFVVRCHSEFDTGSLRFVRASPIPYVCVRTTAATTTTTFLTYVTYVTLHYSLHALYFHHIVSHLARFISSRRVLPCVGYLNIRAGNAPPRTRCLCFSNHDRV